MANTPEIGDLDQIINNFRKAFEQFDRLQNSIEENTAARTVRHVAKMAKNIQHGDVIFLPEFNVWVEVGAWCRMGDRVSLGDGKAMHVSVDADRRLTVRRG